MTSLYYVSVLSDRSSYHLGVVTMTLLKQCEAYLIHTLQTLAPKGLNDELLLHLYMYALMLHDFFEALISLIYCIVEGCK